MQQEIFDFQQITDVSDFYRQFARRFDLPYFGANLDALWDVLTGQLDLPLCITLHHLQQHPQPDQFARIVSVMQEAAAEKMGFFLRIE